MEKQFNDIENLAEACCDESFFVSRSLFLAGCVPTAPVDDVGDNQSINPITISCKKPYVFTQDCSAWSGAKRKINIDGFDVVVAGSEDGSIIVVMDAHFYKNILIDNPFILSSQNHSKASNNSYYTVKKILKQHGINILKVRPLELWGDIRQINFRCGGVKNVLA